MDTNRKALRSLLPGVVLALLASACGDELPRTSDVVTLRVLGVRADQPFALPGERPNLEMLLHDGAPASVSPDGTKRDVQVLWIEGCVNPPGDLYYACYPVLHAVTSYLSDGDLSAQAAPAGLPVGFGTQYRATLPDDIISSRPVGPGVIHPYGLSYVFFAACGGELRKLPDADPAKDFPLGCFQPGTGEALGATDFLYGYFPMYAFEDVTNSNPVVAGCSLDGVVHTGTACTQDSDCPGGEACGTSDTCIPLIDSCSASDPDDCPHHVLRPLLDPGSIEPAVTATVPTDQAPLENTWVSYYSTAGSWKAEGIVIQDPSQGYRDDYEGKWRANGIAPGEARLWAIVRDNRDGVTWVWQDVKVR